MERLEHWVIRWFGTEGANFIPFLSLLVHETNQTHPMLTRILEAAIIGLIAVLGSIYVAVPALQKDIQSLQRDVATLDKKVDENHRDTTDQIEHIKRDIYIPRFQKESSQ